MYTHYQRYSPTGLIADKPVTSSTRLILDEAQKLGIKVRNIIGTNIFELEYRGVTKNFYYQNPGTNTCTGMVIVDSKISTRNVFANNNISVAKGFAIKLSDSEDYKTEVYDSLKKPLVVKPDNGTQGKSITVGVDSEIEYRDAIRRAAKYSQNKDVWIVVEEQLQGFDEYRVLVTRDKVIGVIKRIPANVKGDGVSNLRKLIKIKNSDPRRGDYIDHPPLFKILMDDEMKQFLQKQNLTWRSIPPKNKRIYLRGVSNISMGGDSIDYTDRVHQSVKKICLEAINLIPGLMLGGIDFMSRNIDIEQSSDSYAILEINNSPGLDIHDFPFKGKKRGACIEFLKILFDEL